MKAFLKNYRQSPRKVRIVADLIRGKKVDQALVQLDTVNKKATDSLTKLLKSAVANASVQGANKDNLYVKKIEVNKGFVMKRMMPRAHGSASRINKRTSHITIELEEKEAKINQKSKIKNQNDKSKFKNSEKHKNPIQ